MDIYSKTICPIHLVGNMKYLGVIVDKHLSWEEQISAVTKNVSRGLGMQLLSEKYLTNITVQEMYRRLLEPYFKSSCHVWGVAGVSVSINKLKKLQNRAAKIVTNNAYDASALQIIRKHGWPTINELIESEALKIVYGIRLTTKLSDSLRKGSPGCLIQARENFPILKQIWPFFGANQLLDRNAFVQGRFILERSFH